MVNDELGNNPVAISWGGDTADALDTSTIADGQAVGTGLAFDPRVGNRTLSFESIGRRPLRRHRDSQHLDATRPGHHGPLQRQQLEVVPRRNEFWFAWASFFPTDSSTPTVDLNTAAREGSSPVTAQFLHHEPDHRAGRSGTSTMPRESIAGSDVTSTPHQPAEMPGPARTTVPRALEPIEHVEVGCRHITVVGPRGLSGFIATSEG